jgi:DNA-binding CsgD family transcriptional regulator
LTRIRHDLVAAASGDPQGLGLVLQIDLGELICLLSFVPTSRVRGLTEQQKRIVRYVAQGLGNKEIAAALSIQPSTVAVHLRRMFRKLRLHSRAALAHFWYVLNPSGGPGAQSKDGGRAGRRGGGGVGSRRSLSGRDAS